MSFLKKKPEQQNFFLACDYIESFYRLLFIYRFASLTFWKICSSFIIEKKIKWIKKFSYGRRRKFLLRVRKKGSFCSPIYKSLVLHLDYMIYFFIVWAVSCYIFTQQIRNNRELKNLAILRLYFLDSWSDLQHEKIENYNAYFSWQVQRNIYH